MILRDLTLQFRGGKHMTCTNRKGQFLPRILLVTSWWLCHPSEKYATQIGMNIKKYVKPPPVVFVDAPEMSRFQKLPRS